MEEIRAEIKEIEKRHNRKILQNQFIFLKG